MADPKKDGITHINMYSQAETELGRMLSNFYESSFKLPEHGSFSSVEGYYYWLLSPEDSNREILREVSGYNAKKVGRNFRKPGYKVIREKESFRKKVLKAIYSKVRFNNRIERKLINSSLPLKHYYVYGGEVVEADGTEWLVTGTEKIRSKLKEMVNIREEKGDLFEVDTEKYVLAHCVSSDGKMGAGIAEQFVEKFPGIKESVNGFGVGEAAPHCENSVKIYNLITKEKYFHKPSYSNIRESLKDLRRKMVEKGEEKLAIPRIATGLDGKDWDKVWGILRDVFKETSIDIKVRYFEE